MAVGCAALSLAAAPGAVHTAGPACTFHSKGVLKKTRHENHLHCIEGEKEGNCKMVYERIVSY